MERVGLNLRSSSLTADAEDKKVLNVSRKAREVMEAEFERFQDGVEATLDKLGQQVHPSPDRAREMLRKQRDTALKRASATAKPRAEFEERRKREFLSRLPNLENGEADPAESDVRSFVREADDPEERAERIRSIVEDGPVEAQRALFRSSVPPAVAGFRDAEQRARFRERALRTHDPVAFDSAKALDEDLEKIALNHERFAKAAQKTIQAAMSEFESWTSE